MLQLFLTTFPESSDYDKCINCGICVSKCPTGAIYCEYPERVEKMKQKEKEKKEKERQAKLAEAQAKKAEAEKEKVNA